MTFWVDVVDAPIRLPEPFVFPSPTLKNTRSKRGELRKSNEPVELVSISLVVANVAMLAFGKMTLAAATNKVEIAQERYNSAIKRNVTDTKLLNFQMRLTAAQAELNAVRMQYLAQAVGSVISGFMGLTFATAMWSDATTNSGKVLAVIMGLMSALNIIMGIYTVMVIMAKNASLGWGVIALGIGAGIAISGIAWYLGKEMRKEQQQQIEDQRKDAAYY